MGPSALAILAGCAVPSQMSTSFNGAKKGERIRESHTALMLHLLRWLASDRDDGLIGG